MKRQKKESGIFTYICTIILFGFLTVFMLVDSMPMFLNQYQDFYELESTSGINKDDYVSLYVDGVIGNYAETKHYTNFIPTGKDEHYIIWLDNDEVISLAVKKKSVISQLDALTDATWNYIDAVENQDENATLPEGIVLKGRIRTLDPEVEGYYEEWLNEVGIHSDNMKIYYVSIDTTDTVGGTLFFIVFGLFLTVFGIFGLVTEIRKRKQEKSMGIGATVVSPDSNYDYQMSAFDNPNRGDNGNTMDYENMQENGEGIYNDKE